MDAGGISAARFARVTPFLYRGGRPSAGDLAAFRRLGIKTVVNFNRLGHPLEKLAAEQEGLLYLHLPWTAHWYRYFWIDYYPRITQKFLEIIDRPELHPVYVHCHHGRDRTGMLIAAYRMLREGWAFGDALREMRSFGFNPYWHAHITLFLRALARRR